MNNTEVLRTPDEAFADLPDWPYSPQYVADLPGYADLRMHYVDEGGDGPVFLCLHGEPTWAYLFRRMMPAFLAAGGRVVVPDMFGFGRSDKPVDDDRYTFHFHRNALIALIERLDLKDICLVCQDWGGLLGLTLPMHMPQRFSRLLVMNTTIGHGQSAGKGFDGWRDYVAKNPDLQVGALMQRAVPHLRDAERAAYDAPFPGRAYKAGVRRFPQMVQTAPDMEGVDTGLAALKFWREDWAGESFMAVGMQDPVLGGPTMDWLRQQIKGCPEPMRIDDGGHFLQEWGEPIARKALAHFELA